MCVQRWQTRFSMNWKLLRSSRDVGTSGGLWAIQTDSSLFVESNLTPQNQDLGGGSPPPPEGESGQRNQIGQQPQSDLERHNHGLMMPHRLYAGIDCPDRMNADHTNGQPTLYHVPLPLPCCSK
jgi:hypothetical protein